MKFNFFKLFIYFFKHDLKHAMPLLVMLLFYGAIASIGLEIKTLTLIQSLIFLALLSATYLINGAYSVQDDFQDGTFDWVVAKTQNIFTYLWVRFASTFVVLFLPFFIFGFFYCVILNFGLNIILSFFVYSLILFFGTLGLQLILSMTGFGHAKMCVIFLLLPFFISAFLYFISVAEAPLHLYTLLGSFIFEMGFLTLLIIWAKLWL